MTDHTSLPPGQPDHPDPYATRIREATEKKARSSFGRYRVMAFVTGGFLLLLTFEMLMKYVFRGGESFLGSWVAIVHGWIYVVYLITVFQLWSFMRWDFGRMALLVGAGLIPVLSFVMEPRAKQWFDAELPERVEMSVRLATALRERRIGDGGGSAGPVSGGK